MKLSTTALGIIALVAGLIILFDWLSLNLVVGIFLIIFGILTLIKK
jgi:hypothetical protein